MSDLPLGKIIDASQQRDAIHIAVAPVMASERLQPGQHIGFIEGSTEIVAPIADGPRGLQNKPAIGIVDPFLTTPVLKGQWCWMFLYPQTITSLRHDWTHPAFVGAAPIAADAPDRAWIERFAARLDQTYNRLMQAADLWVETDDGKYGGDYTMDNSETYKNVASDDWKEFWRHYAAITGRAPKHEGCFFTCSC